MLRGVAGALHEAVAFIAQALELQPGVSRLLPQGSEVAALVVGALQQRVSLAGDDGRVRRADVCEAGAGAGIGERLRSFRGHSNAYRQDPSRG